MSPALDMHSSLDAEESTDLRVVPKAPDVLLREFFASVPSASSKNQAETYKGDRIALANAARAEGKQLALELFARNYFSAYLGYHTRGRDDERIRTFLLCKLEAERFLQHTGARSPLAAYALQPCTKIK